jgi:hypothetical protein
MHKLSSAKRAHGPPRKEAARGLRGDGRARGRYYTLIGVNDPLPPDGWRPPGKRVPYWVFDKSRADRLQLTEEQFFRCFCQNG